MTAYTCGVIGLYVVVALVLAVRNWRRRAAGERWERHVTSARAAAASEPPEHHALIAPFPQTPQREERP